jgi:hypothetical protein
MSSRSAVGEKLEKTFRHIIDIKEGIKSRWKNIEKLNGDTDSTKKGLLEENKIELINIIGEKAYFEKELIKYNTLLIQAKQQEWSEEIENIEYMLRELNRIIEYFNEQEQKLKIYNDIHGIKRRAKSSTKRGGSIIKRLPAKPKAKPKATPVKPKAKPKASPVKPKAKPKATPVKPKAKPKATPVKPKAKPKPK